MTTALGELTVTVPARATAIAWLNAYLATGNDDEKPTLCKTLAIEFFESGVLFVACDGITLLRAWVASVPGAEWPRLDEDPDRQLVVRDADGFGAGFMKSVIRATADEDAPSDLHLSLIAADEGATLLLGDAFMSERLSIRSTDQRIDMPLFEGKYADWRAAEPKGGAWKSIERIAIAPAYLGMLGKLRNVGTVLFRYQGADKTIALKGLSGPDTMVRGMLAPQRIDTEAE
jgi:hypothetical protein